jgi:predicted transcriptional regulator
MSLADEYCYEDLDSETVLELFRRHADPVLTAPEVAEAFDISSQAANKRLRKLHESGRLKRKKVGGAAVVYWLCS